MNGTCSYRKMALVVEAKIFSYKINVILCHNSLVQVILFLWSLQHGIEFNCFIPLGSNTISFYTVAIPLLRPTFSQVYHRVLSLVLFFFHCIQALSVKSLQMLQFHIICMLTTRKFTFHFHPASLMTVSPCSPPPLMKFMHGSLQIVFLSTHQRLNFS